MEVSMKKFKLYLAIIMCLLMIPFTVFADEADTDSKDEATTEEKDKLYEFMKEFGGVLDSQESLMRAVMLPFTNYNVDEANKVRKTVAKFLAS